MSYSLQIDEKMMAIERGIMSSSNFNLRGLSSEVRSILKKEAKKLHISVNALILKMIKKELGITQERREYHDLDHLANTWTSADANLFKKNTKRFEEIDQAY